MSFTPPPILCPNCRDWHLADKGECPVPGCEWGHIYFKIDLAQVPSRLINDVIGKTERSK